MPNKKNKTIESTDNLSTKTFPEQFLSEWETLNEYYPSSEYMFQANLFFQPHKNLDSFLSTLITPFIVIISNGIIPFVLAIEAVVSAIRCLVNLFMCKPEQALEHLSEFSICTALIIPMTAMLPINLLIASIFILTRLMATGANICADDTVPSLS